MRILFAGARDWASVAHRMARALNTSDDVTARVYVQHAHPFGYQEDLIGPDDVSAARAFGATADWFVSTGDGNYGAYDALQVELDAGNARQATMHVGSAYRRRPHEYNLLDRARCFERRLVSADSYRFCLEDATAFPIPPVALTDAPLAPLRGPPRTSHSPSSRRTKGTACVLEALRGVDVDIIEKVTYAECLQRRAQSRIFVAQLNPAVGGFGQSSVEALSQGCATLVDVRHVHPKVWTHYARPPLIDVRTAAQLRNEVLRLRAHQEQLEAQQRLSLEWARTFGAPVVAGSYLRDVFRT